MDLRTAIIDTLDPRPIKKVTRYAVGTALEGLALGLFITVVVPTLSNGVRLGIAGVCFVVGAVLAVSSYSALKRRYNIVAKDA